ncbi:hypothetical protein FHS96_004542 [Sphingomonas zeicaulis]|uniref:hypothetical protein n=1 Tax=Sphingomonas zeicaulis TaxID=1632740 RepID=UPI003D1DE83C
MDVLRIDASPVLAQTWDMLRQSPMRALVALAILGTIDALSVALGDAAVLLSFVSGVLALVFQVQIMRGLLDTLGLRDPHARGGLAALFGLGILTNACILLGLVLLVVPGIFLLVRWSMSAAVLFAEDVGPSGAMSRSWALTDGNFGGVLGALAVVYGPILLIAVPIVVVSELPWPVEAALNVALDVVIIAGWHLQVALYSATQIGQVGNRGIVDIFA